MRYRYLLLGGFLAGLLIASLPPAALSDTLIRVQLGAANDACRDDAARLCPGVPAGGGRIAACLALRRPALSPDCHNTLAVAAALKVCEADYHRFCRGVQPGGGRVFQCLTEYARELSEPCNAALEANFPWYRGY